MMYVLRTGDPSRTYRGLPTPRLFDEVRTCGPRGAEAYFDRGAWRSVAGDLGRSGYGEHDDFDLYARRARDAGATVFVTSISAEPDPGD
jgi:hypothetical protein